MSEPTTIPGQLEAIEKRIAVSEQRTSARFDAGNKRFAAIEKTLGEMLAELKRNTEITTEIRDVKTATRVGTRVVKWLGAMAIAGAGIWAAIYALTHGGATPK